ncbi:unnamed protein product [Spirodela intermedia]|uniref:Uncharacterized protein n=2 Tax=Spirodela intermedia TaxID=51605 RepID=A0A7I8L2L5_SPIIN|nr:unnamed protein product [Spirodela intermedia]CAA6667190.1 unnamed protein product [Spirodela intermedia]CAA7404012.1 unnamed protein product [Spirodela intermedia]
MEGYAGGFCSPFHQASLSKPHECDGKRDPSPSAQETPAVRVQPDRCTKTKEPGFHYTA